MAHQDESRPRRPRNREQQEASPLSREELAILGTTMASMERKASIRPVSPPSGRLLLTGFRRLEVLGYAPRLDPREREQHLSARYEDGSASSRRWSRSHDLLTTAPTR